ncbi:hypothetical protein C8R45DRAFT_1101609 [Mycena sanguinolenta]|nr:hypothetical protein C8R45DRAFT_1101609 [Mycena sanguinolenta]
MINRCSGGRVHDHIARISSPRTPSGGANAIRKTQALRSARPERAYFRSYDCVLDSPTRPRTLSRHQGSHGHGSSVPSCYLRDRPTLRASFLNPHLPIHVDKLCIMGRRMASRFSTSSVSRSTLARSTTGRYLNTLAPSASSPSHRRLATTRYLRTTQAGSRSVQFPPLVLICKSRKATQCFAMLVLAADEAGQTINVRAAASSAPPD